MGRYGERSKLAGCALLGLAWAFFAGDAQAALTKPERKAVDIKRVEAASTPSVTFAVVTFKGSIADELGTGRLKKAGVTMSLIPESGATTVITTRGKSKRPEDGRTGTDGFFQIGRDDREMVIVADGLPAATRNIEIATAGPVPLARTAPRQGMAYEFFNYLVTQAIGGGETNETAELLREEEDQFQQKLDRLDEIREEKKRLEGKLKDAKRRLDEADSNQEATNIKKRIKKYEDKLEALDREEGGTTSGLAPRSYFIGHLRQLLATPPKAQCADGTNNDGQEDALVDLADPGCVGESDNDEKNLEAPIDCPAPGATGGTIATINTPQTNRVDEFIIRMVGGDRYLAPVQGESGGPSPLPLDICGPGTNAFYEYRQYTDGDPFGFPDPPPGDRAFQIVIFAQNPMGSGNPGDLAPTLGFAIGTVPTGP